MNARSLILASASPRRSELLRELHVEFQVRPGKAEEIHPEHLTPHEICQVNAALTWQISWGVKCSGWISSALPGNTWNSTRSSRNNSDRLGEAEARIKDRAFISFLIRFGPHTVDARAAKPSQQLSLR